MLAPALSLLVVSGLLVGCGGEPLTPADVAGSYALVEIEGNPLPSLLRSPPGCNFVATSGTLDLGVDGRFRLIVNEAVDCTEKGQGAFEVGRLYMGPYQLDGERLTLVASSSDIRSFSGRTDGAQVTAELPVAPGEALLLNFVFRRGS